MTRREHLYNSGEFDNSIYVIQCGYLKTSTFSRDGRQCLLAIHGPGEVLGEACLVPGVRNETATAMRSALVWRIRSADLLSAVTDDMMMERVVMCLAERMSEQQQAITNLVTMNSEQRLAATLLQLARKLGHRTEAGLRLDERITQDELSGLVGTTRSRIGHFLKKFHRLGYLESPRGAFILINERRLAAHAGV
ncbi:Crp/Fnr family transcriptional regulator [Micromonospora tulbaghiae]|uniref:Crp/Fnr family transcriptional regulator n=1 Tax=Micromonospora tulbaghiae TaxID=479978 RepID=A0AAW4JB57_9ACTN|nr:MULTISPECIES: Crp/Fnr family transcriptional regulator [Micromonospora]KAB1910374.1 Crp/Fnr family transcriptional regulator [Micromonospora sp. AMSO1212t]MBO4139068.1 Crp/Fnr family transcriptional regulator [Micromonospora tulbaghiae]MDX5459272.1 Crp/Fnr family transcriptional regulator [Micromonospora tulbaghiae]SCE73301.1 cAMP-binding domain of CRP or a regulatory subunit of cAMP-dependent protein kinases [Micromonospora tulbaghiae]